MRFASLFTVVAAGASLGAAQYDTAEGTTTSTMTMTQTLTITKCKSDNPNCPAYSSTSTSAIYPVSNSTSSAGPTAYKSTTFVYPTGTASPPATYVPVTPPKGTSAPSTPATVPTAGAESVLVQSGLLLAALGAGIALLA